MGSAPSKKSTVRVIKEQPETSKVPSVNNRAWEQEEDSSPITAVTQEELFERLAVSQEKAREAESRASEANDKLQLMTAERDALFDQLKNIQQTSTHSGAQEQVVKKLQDDVIKLQNDMVVMQQRHKQKLKKLRASSAESRTESALAVFALKDQNVKLSEENTSLLERVRKLQDENDSLSRHASASSSRTQHSTDHEQPLRDQHMQLILDLSQQVSSLDEELSQARQLIRQLQAEKQT